MRRRVLLTLVVAIVATAWPTLPAAADAAFDRGEVPPDADVSVTLRVTAERGTTPNQRIELTAPASFTVRGCQPPRDWVCSVGPQARRVVWERQSSGLTDTLAVLFGLDLHTAAQGGEYAFPTVQTYADGHQVHWTGEDGPPPTLTVTAPQSSDDGDTGKSSEESPEPASSEPAEDEDEPRPSPSPDDPRSPEVAPAEEETEPSEQPSSPPPVRPERRVVGPLNRPAVPAAPGEANVALPDPEVAAPASPSPRAPAPEHPPPVAIAAGALELDTGPSALAVVVAALVLGLLDLGGLITIWAGLRRP